MTQTGKKLQPCRIGDDLRRMDIGNATIVRILCVALAGLLLCVPLSGCLVAGYSSGSGFWIWPGSIVITLILVLIYFLSRH